MFNTYRVYFITIIITKEPDSIPLTYKKSYSSYDNFYQGLNIIIEQVKEQYITDEYNSSTDY